MMHELGLCDAIVKMADEILKEEKVEGVNKIVLEIGELSWKAVTSGTKYEDTELEMEMIPGIARCMDCNKECRAALYDLKCPFCHSEKLAPVSGTDMTIKQIEVYE